MWNSVARCRWGGRRAALNRGATICLFNWATHQSLIRKKTSANVLKAYFILEGSNLTKPRQRFQLHREWAVACPLQQRRSNWKYLLVQTEQRHLAFLTCATGCTVRVGSQCLRMFLPNCFCLQYKTTRFDEKEPCAELNNCFARGVNVESGRRSH